MTIKRREFIMLFGGAAAWPLAARAQQGDRMRRIGVLMAGDENEYKPFLSAFTQALAGLGWTDGRNGVRLTRRKRSEAEGFPGVITRPLEPPFISVS
jgi:hypothetical protein